MDYLVVKAILLQYISDIKDLLKVSRDIASLIQRNKDLNSSKNDLEQLNIAVERLRFLLNESSSSLQKLYDISEHHRITLSKLDLLNEINFKLSNLNKLKSLDIAIKNLLYKQIEST